MREDSAKRQLLYAATETGVFVSFDAGRHWQSLQLNLPHSSMRDLWVHGDDLVLGDSKYGRAKIRSNFSKAPIGALLRGRAPVGPRRESSAAEIVVPIRLHMCSLVVSR